MFKVPDTPKYNREYNREFNREYNQENDIAEQCTL